VRRAMTATRQLVYSSVELHIPMNMDVESEVIDIDGSETNGEKRIQEEEVEAKRTSFAYATSVGAKEKECAICRSNPRLQSKG
jgi:hypothetical protein